MNIAIAGGGTGGHLFPGLALAERSIEAGRGHGFVFFGSRRGIEARLVPAAGFELVLHDLEGLYGRRVPAAARSAAKLAAAVPRVARELRRRRVEVLVGLGGYASAAGVLGAAVLRLPVVLLEQNRKPGLANRSLARLAAAVCTSFADSAASFPPGRCRFTGNPVRASLERLREGRRRETLLVFGGSAGAASLNRAVVQALARLCDALELPPVVHQTGEADQASVHKAYQRAGIDARVVAFIEDMAEAYARARLAVCRAGATSIAELTATATPAVLVPFPSAAGGHQHDNAAAMAAAGAAEIVEDDEHAADRLSAVLRNLLLDPERLDSMAERARAGARHGASDRVLDVLEEVAGPRRRRPRPLRT